MFGNIFKIRPKKFLGIDIGTSAIKIVELRRKGGRLILQNYGELEISYPEERSFRSFDNGSLMLSDADIAMAVKSVCQEAKIQTKEVNFSIPDFSTFFTTFKLPIMTADEVPEAIKYEVRPHIPLPLSEITLDWLITEGQASKTPLKVLVVAIPNDVINQYQQIAAASNLKLKALEPEVFALARSLNFLIGGGNGRLTAALIDIGARSTTCSILSSGVLKISHSFNLGANELTSALAKSLNIDYNKAEELKKKYGIAETGSNFEKVQQNIKDVLTPLIDELLSESKKIFRDFYSREGKEVQKVILAGSTSFLPGLKDYFSKDLEKEVMIANPFSNISYPAVLAQTLEAKGPSYAIAVGLALKGYE